MGRISALEAVIALARNDDDLAGSVGGRIANRHRYGQDFGGTELDWGQDKQSLVILAAGGSPNLRVNVQNPVLQARCYGDTPAEADEVYQSLIGFTRINQRRTVETSQGDALVYYVVRESEPIIIIDQEVRPNNGMPCVIVSLRAEVAEDCLNCPVADFSATPLSGLIPLAVQFTDLTTNDPTWWLWDFGDGKTSQLQNPNHTYSTEGDFDVTLAVSNICNGDTITKASYISATPYLLFDTFSDSDLILLENHDPEIGGPWIKRDTGIMSILSNAAVVDSGSALYTVDVGEVDIVLTSTFTTVNISGAIGFVVRVTDASNHWWCILHVGGSPTMTIGQITGGVATIRAGVFLSPKFGTFEATVTAIGSTITFAVTGADTASISYNSATQGQTETAHGLRAGTGVVTYDNITIEAA